MVYNLTVYDVSSEGGNELYILERSTSNAEGLGIGSDVASSLVASSNVTFRVAAEKIGATLYILNCSDSNGWWITGYTSQSIAEDLCKLLDPYFQNRITINQTTQLAQILDNQSLRGEAVQNAIVINTCGEAVPIPQSYANNYSRDTYAEYCYQLGRRVRQYNWTWVSIVGYPLYYVCNTLLFPNDQNTKGIYGMQQVARTSGAAGLNSFLEGLNNQAYSLNTTWITGDKYSDPRLANVSLSAEALSYCNYYGVHPSPYQTATRALPSYITSLYNLAVTTYVFDQVGTWNAGALYRNSVSGALLALGLARTPDIRLTALGLLSEYKPALYRSQYTARGTSKLVVLQLGQTGGL